MQDLVLEIGAYFTFVMDDPTPVAEGMGSIFGLSAEEMVLVKVRYKAVAATEDDPAMEVLATLETEQIDGNLDDMDDDFKWAVAVASMAEILKEKCTDPVVASITGYSYIVDAVVALMHS